MPPKKGGKKGGKGKDDDAFWEAKEAAAALAMHDGDTVTESAPAGKSAFGNLSSLADSLPDDPAEDGDEGDLLAAIRSQASKKKSKKRDATGDFDDAALASKVLQPVSFDDLDSEPIKPTKKGKKAKKEKAVADLDDDELLEATRAATEDLVEPADSFADKAPKQVGIDDDLFDEPIKPKKGKKSKGSSKVQPEDGVKVAEAADEPAAVTEQAATNAIATAPEGDAEDGAPSGGLLSKKEKERLKKEKEKAKKKAQAAAKKSGADGDAHPDESTDAPPASTAGREPELADADGADEDGEDGTQATSRDKKKKKKKPTAAAVEKAVPDLKAKKPNSRIAALQAQLEAQRAAQEAFEREQAEIRRREEEEERRAEEAERQAEEARKLKKEKERAKRDQLRKEGKLLTPAQKREQQIAEQRRQALLQSGVQIAGLQGDVAPSAPKKRDFRKTGRKAAPAPVDAATKSEDPNAAEPASEADPEPIVPESETAATAHDVKDAWDVASEDDDIKDSWDADSDHESVTRQADGAKSDSRPEAEPANGVKPTLTNVSKPSTNGKAVIAAKESSDEDEDDSEEESDSEDDSDDDEDSDEDSSVDEPRQSAAAQRLAALKAEQAKRRQQRIQEAQAAKSKDDLRSPICCILGHVDTGKTKLLDKVRQTNVQEGEAGGITQQIGATYFPMENIRKKTAVLRDRDLAEYKLPGLLVIDTPGHESFTNLRSRGSSLCNIAVLVIDIMHGLEPQTIESIKLLRDKKTPFIVALNKIDRLYGWEATKDDGFQNTFAKQKANVQREFKDRSEKAILALAEQGLNAKLYFENTNFARFVSIVPTSAHTGEGVPDMLMLLVKLTQERMSDRLMYISELECTVLEVKVIEGLGTTLDVVLSNGILHEGDEIVVCSLNGAIVTNIRALLTPQPLKELRIKGQYVHHKMIRAAMGVKIVAPGLENAIAGSRMLVKHADDDLDELKAEVFSDLTSLLDSVDRSGLGVWVQASTLGSLEALLDFLKTSKIPVAGINIGPVHKKDVVRAGVMLERAPEYAVMLCFDVEVDKEADTLAKDVGLRVFKADIIYHLFDAFTAYRDEIMEAKRKEAAATAVWPCRLKILKPFATRDPIILGCDILQGALRVGTPLCVVKYDADKKKSIIKLGRVSSIELNHKSMEIVKKKDVGAGIAVKIEHAVHEPAKAFGRHFDEKDELYSLITRPSIELLKDIYRSEVSVEEWNLVKALKPLLDIQ